jgi:hypothetical protein
MVRGFADMDRHSRASREPSGIGARDLCDHLVRELIRKYADQPMDLADACLVAMPFPSSRPRSPDPAGGWLDDYPATQDGRLEATR